MKPCRECGHEVSEQAFTCTNCGAPQPAKEKWDGWGFEFGLCPGPVRDRLFADRPIRSVHRSGLGPVCEEPFRSLADVLESIPASQFSRQISKRLDFLKDLSFIISTSWTWHTPSILTGLRDVFLDIT
jgi:hypothetical protein